MIFMPDISLIIDNNPIAVPPGTTILKAAQQLDRQVPTICYHDHCTANGLCRICVVEVDGVKPLLPACLSTVSEGMKVSTSSARRAQPPDDPGDARIGHRSFRCAGNSNVHRRLSRRPLTLSRRRAARGS